MTETSTARPADFDAYWAAVDDELAHYPAAPTLEALALPSDEYSTVYAAKLTSIGPYRIFGYFSVPNGEGQLPGLLITPGYGSVNHLPHLDDRQRYVTLMLMHRGQRLADQPFAAAYPGLLTLGIDDPATYIYRGIVADCLRGAEFLLSRPEVDTSRVGISRQRPGADHRGAPRRGSAAVQASGLLFHRLMAGARAQRRLPGGGDQRLPPDLPGQGRRRRAARWPTSSRATTSPASRRPPCSTAGARLSEPIGRTPSPGPSSSTSRRTRAARTTTGRTPGWRDSSAPRRSRASGRWRRRRARPARSDVIFASEHRDRAVLARILQPSAKQDRQHSQEVDVRSARMLAFLVAFALVAATPHIGRSIATASASTGPMTSGQETVNAPLNDNDDDPCNSDNPRKQKKCHFNQTDGLDDNDNSDDLPPSLTADVSDADPEEDETIALTLHAWGTEITEVWWWVPDEFDDNGNENEEFANVTNVQSCDSQDDCWRLSELTPRHEGVFRIHAKARDSQGRESGELVTEVRVHDDDD